MKIRLLLIYQNHPVTYFDMWEDIQNTNGKPPFGFAFYKVLYDKSGIPVDFEFAEANAVFGSFTGISPSQLIGKTFGEVMPNIWKDHSKWLSIYQNVAINGCIQEVLVFSLLLQKHFILQISSPAKGYLSSFLIEKGS
jgi:hypothetical protein